MPSGIASIPRYQHGGPHPKPPFNAKAFREAVLQGWTVNPRPTAAEQAEEEIRNLVELAASDDLAFESLERRGIPAPEFPSAPRTTSISDEIREILSSNESAFRALERKAAFEKLLKDFVPLSPDAKDLLSPEDLDLYNRRLEYLGGFPDRRNPQELPWELLSPEDRELSPHRSPPRGWPAGTETWANPGPLPDVDPPIRRGISRLRHRAGQGARNFVGATARAIRNRLPSIIATVGAVGTGLGTAIDLAASPTELGSGDLPESPRFTDEEMEIIRAKQGEEFQLLENLGLTPPFPTQPWASPQGSSIRPRGFGRVSGGIVGLRRVA